MNPSRSVFPIILLTLCALVSAQSANQLKKNRLALTHYCDFGNRPHLAARPSPEGNAVDFELAEFSSSDQVGHVTRDVFTIIDANHPVEDWTFLPSGAQPTARPYGLQASAGASQQTD